MIVFVSSQTTRPKKKRTSKKASKPAFVEMRSDPYAQLPKRSAKDREVFVDSVKSTSGDAAPKKEPTFYTGEHLVGISIVHKSCLQPVFSEQEAKDFSSMRR